MIIICQCFIIFISTVNCFSVDLSSFDAYGEKLAVNDVLLVESLASDYSFLVRLSPFNYSLSCTISYNDSNQYVYAVAVHSQATYQDILRFVFIGINQETDVPFIGTLTYTGISGPTYVSTVKPTRKTRFPCDGWQMINYRIHQLTQFISNDDDDDNSTNNDFFVVTVA
jgi:hypothetical protein